MKDNFCSPGVNLPVIQISKTFYGEYKEYHTNFDNKSFMSTKSLNHSIDKIFLFIKFMELNRNILKPTIKAENLCLVNEIYIQM